MNEAPGKSIVAKVNWVVTGAVTVKDRLVEWPAPPPDALIVTVTVPSVALEVAENVTVREHVGLHGLLVNVAVTPLGKPDAEYVTGVVVPLTNVAVMDEVGLAEPWTAVRALGDGTPRLKSNAAGAETVRERLVEWLAPPPETLMVIVDVPSVAVDVAEKWTVTVQVGLHELFVKVAVTPVGRPDAEKVTCAVVPLTNVASIEAEGLSPPWTTVKLLGEGVERLKSKT